MAVAFDAGIKVAESWADALLAEGASSVDATDASAGTAAEVPVYGEPAAHPWPVVRLTALFAEAAPWETMLSRAAAAVGEPLPKYSTSAVATTDWVLRTQAQFAPIRVDERLWIVPSWCAPPDPAAIAITLDPGLAFGTGAHPSTLLCLRWLAAHMPHGASVLDYGCGSGILAIAAAKLGARTVAGVDIDPQAVETSRENAKANAVPAVFTSPEDLAPGTFDLAVANILANPLEILAPLLAGRVRPGGQVVLAGILEAQTAAVRGAYERWFNIGPWGSTDGWVALAGARRAGESPGSAG